MKALAVAKRVKRAIAAKRVMMMCELTVLCVLMQCLRLCHLCACTKIDLSLKISEILGGCENLGCACV